MTWYWYALEQFADLVEATMLVVLISKFFLPKRKGIWPSIAVILFLYGLINLVVYINSPILVNIGIYYVAGISISFIQYKGRILTRSLIPLLMVALLLISEVMAVGVMQFSYHASIEQLQSETVYRMLGIILSKLSLIVMVYIAGFFSKKQDEKIPFLYSISILAVPFVSMICIVTISQFILNLPGGEISPLWFITSSFGLLLVNLLIIFLFQALMNYSRNQNQLQLMVQQSEMLSSHLQETNTLQEEANRLWHDMKNHFTIIQWMVKTKNFDKLEKYMHELNETVENTMQKIQSGNPVLDAILNRKYSEARKHNIDMIVNACVPDFLSIDDIDLNIVFSNALDNALEACNRMPDESARFINVDTYIRNEHLVLTVKNSFTGELKTAGSELKTTKKDARRHGIGIGNMKRAAEKYDGHIMTRLDDNVFVLSAVMYCNAKSVAVS